MARHSKLDFVIVVLAAALLCVPSLFAQGPRLSFLTDPDTDLGFAACHIYFDGGSRRKIPFLPVVNAKGAPCGTNRYSTDIRLKAPVVFVGDGIVREQISNPYNGLDVAGKVVMLSYDFPDKLHPDSAAVTMEERVREAVKRKAAGVLLFSALAENPFPVYRETEIEKIPEIPIIVINKRNAAVILASDGRNTEETFRKWETEGNFLPGELIVQLDLRINSKFDMIDTDSFTFAFQPGIPRAKAEALSRTNERAVSFILNLFKDTEPRWKKTFTAYFSGYDAKEFYVHHIGKGLSNDAGIFMWFDGIVPDFGLAAHENTHMLIGQNWGGSSSFLAEGIGKYAEAMATDKGSNHRITQTNLRGGKLFPLGEMAKISIGSDPRTEVAYPAAGSFVQFLVEKYSLKKLKAIYQGVAKADDDAATQASWLAVYGKSLRDLEGEWLTFLNTFR
jgi:PA domain